MSIDIFNPNMGEHEHHIAAAAIAAASSSSLNQQPVVVFMYHAEDRQNNVEVFDGQEENSPSEPSQEYHKSISMKRPASNDLELNAFQNKRICPSIHRQRRSIIPSPKDSSQRFKRTYTIPSSPSTKNQTDEEMCLRVLLNSNTNTPKNVNEVLLQNNEEGKEINPLKKQNHLLMIIRHFPFITNIVLVFFHLICYLILAFGTFLSVFVCHLYFSRSLYFATFIEPLTFYICEGTLAFITGMFLVTSIIGLSAHFLMKTQLYSWHTLFCIFLSLLLFANVKWSSYWSSPILQQVRPQLNITLHLAQTYHDSKNMLIMDYVQSKFSCCGVVSYRDWCLFYSNKIISENKPFDISPKIGHEEILRVSSLDMKSKTWPGQTVPLGYRNKRFVMSESNACSLPMTCCIQTSNKKKSPLCESNQLLTNTKTNGCAPILEEFLISFEWLSKIICFVFGVLLIINTSLSFALRFLIRMNRVEYSLVDTNPLKKFHYLES